VPSQCEENNVNKSCPGSVTTFREAIMEWKQNDEHQDEGRKSVFGVSPSCLGRAMVFSFLSLVVVSLPRGPELTCIGLGIRD